MVDEDLLIRHDLLGWPVEAGHATSSVDVAIVGGGITGLGAAHALRAGDTTLREQLGLDTDLVSPCGGAPGIVYDGRLRHIPPGIMGGLATRPLSVARPPMIPGGMCRSRPS